MQVLVQVQGHSKCSLLAGALMQAAPRSLVQTDWGVGDGLGCLEQIQVLRGAAQTAHKSLH